MLLRRSGVCIKSEDTRVNNEIWLKREMIEQRKQRSVREERLNEQTERETERCQSTMENIRSIFFVLSCG